MKKLSVVLAAIVATIAFAYVTARLAAQEGAAKAPVMVSLADLKWIELSEKNEMQFAVVSGDHQKGAYVEMRKVRAGYDSPLHAHSNDLTDVVISGVWYLGKDVASAREFGPGSVLIVPANWPHVSGCRSGSDCVLYQDGKGKFDFKPVH